MLEIFTAGLDTFFKKHKTKYFKIQNKTYGF